MNEHADFIWFYVIVGLLFSLGNITAFFRYGRFRKYGPLVIVIAIPISLSFHAVLWPFVIGWFITTKNNTHER